jgi:hypothetical protein
LQSRPFPTEYHHYGDTAWTYQNLPDAILAFHSESVARFIVHDHDTRRIVDKNQIYRLIDQLALQLPAPLIEITHKYTRASFHIDRIRDPHPRFGWWWLPKAWKARLTRGKMHRSLMQAVERS